MVVEIELVLQDKTYPYESSAVDISGLCISQLKGNIRNSTSEIEMSLPAYIDCDKTADTLFDFPSLSRGLMSL